MVSYDWSAVFPAAVRIRQVFDIVSNGQYNLVCDYTFIHQVKHHQVRHFFDNKFGLFEITGAV